MESKVLEGIRSMQTFLISSNPSETAKILDYRRLGKQRVEVISIANVLLNGNDGWSHHPATKMWKGYEPYLIKVYLKAMMDEWVNRGYDNTKCQIHYDKFLTLLGDREVKQPHWFSEEFFTSHKSNLLRKNHDYFSKYFPSIPDNLPYIWPSSTM